MMLSVLFLLHSALSPSLAWIPVQDWDSGNVTASVGSSGQCVCHVFLPDTTFPADRVEHMQQVSKDLILEVEIQTSKMVKYVGKLVTYLAELKDLEARLVILGSSPDDYVKLDFELLRIELRELKALVSQLKDSLNFTSWSLRVQNMTLIVNQLETYDKSNLEVIRHQFAKLQKKDQDIIKPDIGNCNHTGILSISNLLVVQFNAHKTPDYLYGGWGKDSKPIRGQGDLHFYGAYSSPGGVYDFYFYSSYKNLLLRNKMKLFDLPNDWIGVGNNYIVHSNVIYYQHNTRFSMTKINLTSSQYDYRVISAASQSFSYGYSTNQNLDFAADEIGLWVLYASTLNKGQIVIAKIDEKSFGIENEWITGVYKQSAGNAFMNCGVMYATRSVDISTEEIFYAYDTKTKQERSLSMDYNPSDQKLYMYNDGFYMSYNIRFDKE